MKVSSGARRTFNMLLLSETARYSPSRHRFFGQLPMVYSVAAHSHKVPLDLLYTVSVVLGERIEKVEDSSLVIPWPWVLLVDGAGIKLGSLSAAREALHRLALSQRHVQVGLMHLDRTLCNDMSTLLSPLGNLSFSSRRLRTYFERHADWWQALKVYAREDMAYSDSATDEFIGHVQNRIHLPFR